MSTREKLERIVFALSLFVPIGSIGYFYMLPSRDHYDTLLKVFVYFVAIIVMAIQIYVHRSVEIKDELGEPKSNVWFYLFGFVPFVKVVIK